MHEPRVWRLLLLSICSLVLFHPCMAAGQKEVIIPALVTDKAGSHIPKLEKNDFSIEARNVTLEGVEEVGPVASIGDPGSVPVIIFFDAISLAPPFQTRVSESLLSLLSTTISENAPVPILLVVNDRDSLRVIHEMGTSNEILAAAIERLANSKKRSPRPAEISSDPQFESKVSAEFSRLQQLTQVLPSGGNIPNLSTGFEQLGALERLATMLQQGTRRKLLVWIGAHFPFEVKADALVYNTFTFDSHTFGSQEMGSLTAAYESAILALNRAHISVCPLQVEGPLPRDPIHYYVDRTRNGLDLFAKRTGGVVLDESHGMQGALAKARRSNSPYYLLHLGVNTSKTPEWKKLTVKVNNPDLRLRTASGFFEVP